MMGPAADSESRRPDADLLPQLFHLPAQPAIAANQASKVDRMNHPSGNVGGVEELNRIHSGPRPNGALALADCDATPPGPSNDSRAWASSSSRCKRSRRYRHQQTSTAKQE